MLKPGAGINPQHMVLRFIATPTQCNARGAFQIREILFGAYRTPCSPNSSKPLHDYRGFKQYVRHVRCVFLFAESLEKDPFRSSENLAFCQALDGPFSAFRAERFLEGSEHQRR